MPMTLEEGVNRVLESNHSIVGFALLADAIDVKYQTSHTQPPGDWDRASAQPLAITFQKNSPLRMKINETWFEILLTVF